MAGGGAVIAPAVERCRAWIDAALAHGGGTHTFEDVAQGIADGRMQLWAAGDGCIVTEIVIYPRKTVCNGFLAGGDMARVLDMVPAIEAWAKAQGCDAAELTGRMGWARVFPPHGYAAAAVTMRKVF